MMVRRRGVSLLEVMFAIGVIAVGLLGVIAVLPLALSQVGRGDIADRSTRVGINAVAAFDMLWMRNPDTWRYAGGGRVGHPSVVDDPSGSITSNRAFCIDPRFVATNGSGSNTTYDATLFPYLTRSSSIFPDQPRMTRVSLARNPSNLNSLRMLTEQADLIFVAEDELSFELPKDKTKAPQQQFGAPKRINYVKRKSKGTMSWMATVAPKIDDDGSFKDTYTLSIVIFNRRDVKSAGRNQTMFEDANSDGIVDPGDVPTYNERVTWIVGYSTADPGAAQFHGDGYGGGDVTLEAQNHEALKIRSGDWIMLMQNLTSTTPYTPLFRWYRVAESEPQYFDGTEIGRAHV
mgnify:CR=1 FL=1